MSFKNAPEVIFKVTRVGRSAYHEPVQLSPSSPTVKREAIKAPPQIKPPLFLALLFSAINYAHLACDCWWQLFDGVNKNAVNNRWLRSLFVWCLSRAQSPKHARRRICRCSTPNVVFVTPPWDSDQLLELLFYLVVLVCGLFKCKTNTTVPLSDT